MDRWTKEFSHRGVSYMATFVKQPFREGVEVSVSVNGTEICLAETGLGEQALLHRIKFEIDSILRAKPEAQPSDKEK